MADVASYTGAEAAVPAASVRTRASGAMFKAAKTIGAPARAYVRRVVVRERDWTVLHFDDSR